MAAYYNEIDPYAAAWLRNLIAAGHIADGVVDERSIEDVFPDDLRGFVQCHFFAGIGVWSHALRAAGWPDDRPAWTGSCPCQPFSDAGKGAGFADKRHLWPAFHHLIAQRRPPVVFGEQVASSDAMPWLDLVQDDLEAMGYAFGAIPFPAASVGAPHIRDRLYWVADASSQRRRPERPNVIAEDGAHAVRAGQAQPGRRGATGLLGNAGNEGLDLGVGFPGVPGGARGTDARQAAVGAGVHVGAVGNPMGSQRPHEQQRDGAAGQHVIDEPGAAGGSGIRLDSSGALSRFGEHGATAGFWADADWLFCRDNRWRPVEPGTFPLAHGAPARVGRLRAYGNAINAEAARVFIEAYL